MRRTLTTLPLVERVVFLRKVPLFANLAPQDLQPVEGEVEVAGPTTGSWRCEAPAR